MTTEASRAVLSGRPPHRLALTSHHALPLRPSSASIYALSFYFSQTTGQTECSTPPEALEMSSTRHPWQCSQANTGKPGIAVCQNNLRFRHVVGAQPVAHPSKPHEHPTLGTGASLPNYLHNLKPSLSLGAASCIVPPSNIRSRSGICHIRHIHVFQILLDCTALSITPHVRQRQSSWGLTRIEYDPPDREHFSHDSASILFRFRTSSKTSPSLLKFRASVFISTKPRPSHILLNRWALSGTEHYQGKQSTYDVVCCLCNGHAPRLS